jgi:hypothetical protein
MSPDAFSPHTIEALTLVFTGGSGSSSSPSIGSYRRGFEIQRDLRANGIAFDLNNGSRVPATRAALDALNGSAGGHQTLVRLIEFTCDPRDYLEEPSKLEAAVAYMNKRLEYDGYALRKIGVRFRLQPLMQQTGAAVQLSSAVKALDMESVAADFERAMSQVDLDPEDAVTSACSTIESVCKCLLDEMGEAYPTKQDIGGLVKAVTRRLNLSPDRTDISADIKQLLGGLANACSGIGALRTHSGDAHGRGKRRYRLDARVARLAVNAASTVSLFFIETWRKRTSVGGPT